ncbi:MAG TPA: TetR/AcrR family transcriptional regulator [Ktedonobacteraceae bacterium]|jgi:AcrR family transcriptional regulator|nr:TetR/AcrR family transcriptional regulator [Ktedonobacteraceae bacterium]
MKQTTDSSSPSTDGSEHRTRTCVFHTTGSTLDGHDTPVDRRIQRTRQLLREALFELIIERGYEKIAIADITERANIGRTTFYLHYQEKEELLKASLKTLMRELQLDVEPSAEEICPFYIRCIRIFQHVAQRRRLYLALLSETGSLNVGNVMRMYFAELFQRYTLDVVERENASSLGSELIAAHAAGSLFGLISWWLHHENSPSAEEMGSVYFQLMVKGVENVSL